MDVELHGIYSTIWCQGPTLFDFMTFLASFLWVTSLCNNVVENCILFSLMVKNCDVMWLSCDCMFGHVTYHLTFGEPKSAYN